MRQFILTSSGRAALAAALLLPGTTALAQAVPTGMDAAEPTRLDDIIVTAAPFGISAEASLIAVDVLDRQALSTAPAGTLGDVLSGLPGVRSTAFSPGASRPVIRGLSGPRVQVLTNGMGLIDASSLSPDHQVAADPGEAVRIEVLRGPQTLAYGGSAIGGVVNVIDGRIPTELPANGLEGQVVAQASSVDDGRSLGVSLVAGRGPLVFTLDAMDRRSGDYDIPVPAESRRQVEDEGETYENTGTATAENTFAQVRALGGGFSLVGDRGFIGLSVKRTQSDYGVPGHAHHHHDDDDHDDDDDDHDHDHHDDEAVTIGLKQTRYDLRGEWRFADGPIDRVRVFAGYADYTHTEYEGHDVGTVFTSRGLEGRVELVMARRGGWNAAWGLQGLSRDFDAVGHEAYVPAVDIREVGAYTLHRYDAEGWGLEGGLRLDRRSLDPAAGTGRLDFSNVSVSAGLFFKPHDALFLGLSVSRNGRAPTETELFAEGPHVATRSFEIGDADLDSETVVSIEGTLHYEQGPWTIDLHLFRADYDGFIDLRPTGAEEDDLPVFHYVQTDAAFHGLEARVDYRAWQRGQDSLVLGLGYDRVRGSTDLGVPARVPPWSLSARAQLAHGPWTARLNVRRVGRQDRVADFELPTDGHTTADLYLGWSPDRASGLTLYVEGRNLGDVEIREHTSFLKDMMPLPGRNFRLGAAYRF